MKMEGLPWEAGWEVRSLGPSRSASKKPSKNRSERMASGGAWVFEGKSAEEAEGSSSLRYTGRKRWGGCRCERVPGGLEARGKALIFYGKFMVKKVLGEVYSGGVY
jgi:hypothetical protein